jgi:hypothetical protein
VPISRIAIVLAIRPCVSSFFESLHKSLFFPLQTQNLGLRVKNKHGPERHRITGISDKSASVGKVPLKTAEGKVINVTVVEYWKKMHGIDLDFPHMPLILCGPKKYSYPIEMLQIRDKIANLRNRLPEYIQSKATDVRVCYAPFLAERAKKYALHSSAQLVI